MPNKASNSRKRASSPKVFFNASVILAGLHSPSGGSAKLLNWVKSGHITGIISEVIADEVTRRSPKVGINPDLAKKQLQAIFALEPIPPQKLVEKYHQQIPVDQGDAHVFASAHATGSQFLVSLDKKHILILRSKIRNFKVVSPGELIQILNN